jgi:hypothetical protein
LTASFAADINLVSISSLRILSLSVWVELT